MNEIDKENGEIVEILPLYKRGIQFGEIAGFEIIYYSHPKTKEVKDEKV